MRTGLRAAVQLHYSGHRPETPGAYAQYMCVRAHFLSVPRRSKQRMSDIGCLVDKRAEKRQVDCPAPKPMMAPHLVKSRGVTTRQLGLQRARLEWCGGLGRHTCGCARILQRHTCSSGRPPAADGMHRQQPARCALCGGWLRVQPRGLRCSCGGGEPGTSQLLISEVGTIGPRHCLSCCA